MTGLNIGSEVHTGVSLDLPIIANFRHAPRQSVPCNVNGPARVLDEKIVPHTGGNHATNLYRIATPGFRPAKAHNLNRLREERQYLRVTIGFLGDFPIEAALQDCITALPTQT